METETDLPKSVTLFRKILNHVKRSLLEGKYDENADEEDAQNISNLKDATERIQQFGNIVLSLLKNSDISTKEQESVKVLFKKHHFYFTTLSPTEHELCEHYVHNDVFMYPYDLNTSHIDVVEKSS
jgi:DNA replication protein DnaD